MKYYIMSEEELAVLLRPHWFGASSFSEFVDNFLKSKTSVEEIAVGGVDDICRGVGRWSTNKFNNLKYKIFIQEVQK